MSLYAKILTLSYDSAIATKGTALKSYWRSVRLIKEAGTVNPLKDSSITNILLNGKCLDPENRNLYVFYIDTYYSAAWIIEINIDTRVQTVVYYDPDNAIGFNPDYKIYNARVVHGRLVWTDGLNPIYQMDIERAKKSFYHQIGYGEYPNTEEWDATSSYSTDQIVSDGNKFYKSLMDSNVGNEPKTDDGTHWYDLNCLIEDAYYSMNVRNFYFEAMPPTDPPEVTYQSDNTRKINNLRQALFQFAYRYVYMDWRRSTFSPASIVPVPQMEEETATGLANEMISLNNRLQVIVNSGGEEVRAVEVIARSSDDKSKWYLIETINKFETQERGTEISRTSEPEYIALTMTLPLATAEAAASPDAIGKTLGMTVINPDVVNSYVSADTVGLDWTATESGVANAKTSTITAPPLHTYLTSFPSWLTILGGDGLSLVAGMTIANGETISAYPTYSNTGAALSGYIVLTNAYGDITRIIVTQSAPAVIPPTPITPTMEIDPLDGSGMALVGSSLSSVSGTKDVSYSFVPNHPGYSSGEEFTLFWRATVNGLNYGNGTFPAYDEVANNGIMILTSNLAAGDTVIIYISAAAIIESVISKIGMGVSPLLPETINSSVNSDNLGMSWTGEQSGLGDAETALIGCPPLNCTITSKPDWLTIRSELGYDIYAGWTISDGETISVFPTADNLGSARSGYIVLTNDYGDTVTIIVSQAAAAAPPSGVPVYPTIVVYSGDSTGLTIPGSYASALSGSKSISWTALIAHSAHEEETWTMYWRVKINDIVQGSGSFVAYNGSQGGEVITNANMLAGDTIVVEFSSITF